MKRGTKLIRICAECHQPKEQVKDRMAEDSDGWRCIACRRVRSAELMVKLNWPTVKRVLFS